mmetsp:Transcript_14711/g.46280  ORF Transcript_14711/g.46280 Transcript_14711/m.46280 type:complete len:256 (-) Transcript_14711:655-1422(-)
MCDRTSSHSKFCGLQRERSGTEPLRGRKPRTPAEGITQADSGRLASPPELRANLPPAERPPQPARELREVMEIVRMCARWNHSPRCCPWPCRGFRPCGVRRCIGLGSAVRTPVHGVLRPLPPTGSGDRESCVSAATSGGLPGHLVHRPKTPSREPTAMESLLEQKAPARIPSAPQMAARRWWRARTRRPLGRTCTRYTESSDATETSQVPKEEKAQCSTPLRSQRVSCTCCSRIQPLECQTRSVWSTPQETKRES